MHDITLGIAQDEQVKGFVRRTPWLMQVLDAVRPQGWVSWCIGAGAVRCAVWEALHGRAAGALPPSSLGDIDVVYFDAREVEPDHWQSAQALARQQLQDRLPWARWEVVNQAAVHCWYRGATGQPVPPFVSLEQAVASWPEVATCVGVYLDARDELQLVAPLGLDDLLALRVRYNSSDAGRVSAAVYAERMACKRWQCEWPGLKIESASQKQ
ncbi:MAG: nucleotidyltransferase family protein [Comamonas sp.]|jgi:hypothetical protein|nr:nucleotidyltransferase family protein [Comamonas sp.]